MASSLRGFCDALIEDLQTNVPALTPDSVKVHRYVAWDPEHRVAEVGERHLAVYPDPEALEEAIPLVTGPGGDMLQQVYRVAYWEHAGDESSRAQADESAAGDILDLYEQVRARLYAVGNVFLGGADEVHYVGGSIPARSSSVRWFEFAVRVRTSLVLS